jgi:predicted GNAT family acetyltransferase
VSTDVVRNDERSRYELVVDGQIAGFADFRVEGDVVVLPHTVVDPARRGQGLAAVLVASALDDIDRAGRRVVPACWYVADFIDRNPRYAALVSGRE